MVISLVAAVVAVLHIPVPGGELVQLSENVYAEPGLAPLHAESLLGVHRQATVSVERVFGTPRRGSALVLFCRSAECKVALGAPPTAAASPSLGFARDGVMTTAGWLATPVVVVSVGAAIEARLLAHELVHAEMKVYAPYDSQPTWFNEGVATWLSNNPDCDHGLSVSTFDVTTLETKAQWQAFVARPGMTLPAYCQSAAAVGAWLSRWKSPLEQGTAVKQRLAVSASAEKRVRPQK